MQEPSPRLITPADLRAERANTVLGLDADPPDAAEVRARTWREVPWRTIFAAVFVVLGAIVLITFVRATIRIVAWVAIAGFFAVVLAPAVRRLERRLGDRRGVAASLVVLLTLLAFVGLILVFLMPIRTQLVSIVTDLPGTINDAGDGRGPAGRLMDRLGLVNYVNDNEREIQNAAARLTDSPVQVIRIAVGWIVTFVSVTLITILMLTQGGTLGKTMIELVPARKREPLRRALREAGAAVSAYMVGNLVISLIAGVSAFAFLVALRVPNALVLALLVAFTDLLPLVGATIGAAVCSLAAFLQSTNVGIAAVVFFVFYQQVENYVIYPQVMSKAIKVNPLVVLLSVLIGVELFGLLGALLAVPASGALDVAIRATRRELLHQALVLPDSVDLDADASADA